MLYGRIIKCPTGIFAPVLIGPIMVTTKTKQLSEADVPLPSDGTPVSEPARDSWRVRLLLILFGLIVSLLFIELAFRITRPAIVEHAKWQDRPNHWYLPESSLEPRDFYYSPHKAPGVFRIVVVGDSFTYGGKGQFDDAFSKRLERMLNLNNKQPKVEVLNWGVPGYSTAQEAWLVKRALSEYEPDLVLLEVTLNDPELQPYRITHPYQKADGEIELSAPLFRYWQSLGFVASRVLNSLSYRDYEKYYFDLYSNEEAWSRFAGAMKNIVRMSEGAKVPFMAVVFPLFSHPIDENYVFKPLHEKIDTLLAGLTPNWVDITADFNGIPPSRLQAIPGKDSHPNEIAHRIAADAIYTKLAALNLIPDEVKIKKMTSKGRNLSHPLPRIRNGDEPDSLKDKKESPVSK